MLDMEKVGGEGVQRPQSSSVLRIKDGGYRFREKIPSVKNTPAL